MRMRLIVICGLPRSIIFFPHFLINGMIFEETLQLLPETFLILRWNERDMIKNAHWNLREVSFILVQF